MKPGALYLLGLLLTACSSTPKVFHANVNRAELFPPGVYRHAVEITSDQNQNRFQGVVRLQKDKVVVAGLGPLNSTLFRITEDRATKDIRIEVFQSQLAKHQEKILEFYSILRELFLLPASTPDQRKIPGQGYDVQVTFEKWDQNHIPEKFTLRHPRFTVTVGIEGYDV